VSIRIIITEIWVEIWAEEIWVEGIWEGSKHYMTRNEQVMESHGIAIYAYEGHSYE
jgi:hypothetical protein